MPEQEALPTTGETPFDPMDHGLFRRFIDTEGHIIAGEWMQAYAVKDFVGTCRRCGSPLVPMRPEVVNERRTDYEAICSQPLEAVVVDGVRRLEGCGWRCNAPGGVTSRRSGRKSEQPRGSKP